ncbi:phage tail tape measure protein [Runella salmonicolor]|uniref:Phage tail tape measure protein n=1 Tax=Runella salmonicolor TaxID=2950278 RepID=A0ABT1FRN3_9BACT|nr:phage tail tape measure protein [Runella salmonicolor]MCP1384426.1 phage tail tape measure protein [Runella salmonicolor]
MELRDKSILDLFINGEPAVDSLKKLDTEIDTLKAKQKELKKELDMKDLDPAKRTELIQQYKEVSDRIQDTTKAKQMLRREMDLEELSIKELKQLLRDYKKEWEAATDPAIRAEMKARMETVSEQLTKVGVSVRGQQGIWSDLKGWMMSAFTITAIVEAGRALYTFFSSSTEEFKKFQTAAQELSAITGLTGKDLKYLTDQAKEVGPTMGKTGEEMLKAYQLMGSAKPELLANKEALAAVTKEAIALSHAGKIDLPDAARVTANSLNQFGAGADQASRFINVMAAGAKEGAAEIVEVGSSLKAAGTVANAAGLSFEQTNATLQSMSTIALKGEQAGTMLRNVLIKLQTGADETNPKVVGLDKALENLGKQNLSTAEMAKMFGTENIVAAQHMVKNREEIGKLTEKMTGTNEAYEQAAKNNDTLEFKGNQALAMLTNQRVELGEKLAPYVGKVIDGFITMVKWFGEATEKGQPLQVVFRGISEIASTVWDIISTLAGTIWDVTKLANPWIDSMDKSGNTMKVLSTVLYVVVASLKSVYGAIQVVVDGFRALVTTAETAWAVLKGDVSISEGLTRIGGSIKTMSDNASRNFSSIGQGFKDIWKDDAIKAATTAVEKHGKSAKAVATDVANHDLATHGKTLTEKEQKELAKRTREAAQEKEKAEKIKADALAATEDLKNKTQVLKNAQIADELTRKKAQMLQELNEEIARNNKGKADALTKAEYEIALRNNYKTKVEALDAEYRKKHIDEETKRLEKLNSLETQQRNAIQTAEFNTKKTTLETNLKNESLNAEQRKALQMQLNQLILDNELRRIQVTADKERLEANKTSQELLKLAGNDAAKKKEIGDQLANNLKQIDNKMLADKAQANQEHQDKVKKSELDALQARHKTQQDFFSALKSLMTGDYNSFINFLNQKYANQKAANNKELQDANNKGQAILQGAQVVVSALQKMNELNLQKQLANITKEKNAQLTAWNDQYKRGIISKEQYEKGVEGINKEAAEKEKAEKLKAWKRDQNMQIAMALINAAMAALKSMATMGFPLGLIGVAASAAMAAIQIGIIKRQQPPSFQYGGFVRNAGIPEGPRHGSSYGKSGIALVRRDTNEEVGEMEGEEPIMVLSKDTYRNNRNTIHALLNSSLHRNGAPIYAEKGAVFGSDGGTYDSNLRMYYQGGMVDDTGSGRPSYNENNEFSAGGQSVNQGGGYYNQSNAQADTSFRDGGYDSGGSNYSEEYGSPADATVDSGTQEAVGSTQGEIARSQTMMENIEKNTAATVAALDKLGVLDNILGTLGSIENWTRESAQKPPVTVNQITQTQQNHSNVDAQSTFG